MKSSLFKISGMIAVSVAATFADPPAPTVPIVNSPCQDGPKMNGTVPDTVAARLPGNFVSLFNGKDLTGWWENCTPHTTDKVLAGVWLVDPSQEILYSRDQTDNGGVLVTNNTYEHYEIVMDLWPSFGNDGGIFNRVTKSGKNWQTTIDYISGSGVAGSFNEGGWTAGDINHDPFRFGGTGPTTPTVPTGDADWTQFTKNLNPTTFGCSAGGCVASDFQKIWDVNGWNQIRVKFYDGLTAGRSVTMETFLRKLGAPNWVPVYKQTRAVVTPKGPIGIQIHGNGRWKDNAWNAYRNIKIRPLKIDGTPDGDTTPVSLGRPEKSPAPEMHLIGGVLTGVMDSDYEVTLRNVSGQIVEKFQGTSGAMRHALTSGYRGVLVAELKNNRGIARIRLSRI
jgi:hypothetical protein